VYRAGADEEMTMTLSASVADPKGKQRWWRPSAGPPGRSPRRLLVVLTVPVLAMVAAIVPASAATAATTRPAATPTVTAVASAVAMNPLGWTGNGPAAPAKSRLFLDYQTVWPQSRLSSDTDTDYSARMAEEIENVAEKALAEKIDKVAKFLTVLANALAVITKSHPYAVAVVALVASTVALVGAKTVIKVLKWIKGILYRGHHKRTKVWRNGFYSIAFTYEGGPPNGVNEGWVARTCPSSKYSCGSPGRLHKEYWP
jgi:hypothetical protein